MCHSFPPLSEGKGEREKLECVSFSSLVLVHYIILLLYRSVSILQPIPSTHLLHCTWSLPHFHWNAGIEADPAKDGQAIHLCMSTEEKLKKRLTLRGSKVWVSCQHCKEKPENEDQGLVRELKFFLHHSEAHLDHILFKIAWLQ